MRLDTVVLVCSRSPSLIRRSIAVLGDLLVED
jgi:hypothetical protein